LDKNLREEMMSMRTWAVSGVTAKKDRFGYKIWKELKEHKYETYGVNPNYDEIEGEKIYNKLSDIPVKIDVLDMVVSPKLAIPTLEEAKDLGIEYIFFQPGSYNDEVVEKAEELGLKYLVGDCVYAILRSREEK